TDGTAEAVRERHPEVRLLRSATNRGFTGGVRIGAETSESDLLILLNNDAVPQPGWLEALVRAIDGASGDVVAVGGKIVDDRGERADFVRGAMTFDGHGFQPGFRKRLAEVDEPAPGAEILFACGGNLIARREDFLRAGGFDDDYFAYLEDVDFGWRSWIAGERVLWEPGAVVRHRSSATSDRLGAFERGVLFERNALQTAVKNYGDELFPAAVGASFLAALHRVHRFVVDRNPGTARLRRPPLDEAPIEPPPSASLLARAARKLGLRIASRTPAIDDELTAMQFRAIEWFFRHADRIMAKRGEVQARRRRSDEEILAKFPALVVPTYHGDEELMASPLFEAFIARLPHRKATLGDMIER
ncbi:MAG: glycosyltransferase, partial [Thermoanaerobaculia bacterium]